MKASEIIQGTLDRLTDPEGWWKGESGDRVDRPDGCVVTAASYAFIDLARAERWSELDACADLFGNEKHRAAFDCIRAELPAGYSTIPAWNDDPATSFEDMRLVLKRAKARAEEVGE